MNDTKRSVFLSLVLRHDPSKAGISLTPDGYADVQALLRGLSEKQPGWDLVTLERIVREDEKGRYSFSEDRRYIRVNQGHSVMVNVPMEEREPPEFLYHGTTALAAEQIMAAGGIKKMKRLHVHLSSSPDAAKKVGGRRGCHTDCARGRNGPSRPQVFAQ